MSTEKKKKEEAISPLDMKEAATDARNLQPAVENPGDYELDADSTCKLLRLMRKIDHNSEWSLRVGGTIYAINKKGKEVVHAEFYFVDPMNHKSIRFLFPLATK